MRPALTNALTNAIRSAFSYIPTELEQWVAKPDGITQVWVLTEDVPVFVGDIVKLNFYGGDAEGQTRYFLGDPNYQFGLFNSNNEFTGGNVIAKIDGTPISLSSTQVPLYGLHELEIQITKAGLLRNIGGRDRAARMNIPVLNFSLERGGEVIHEIALTNKEQGATQIATVGSVNAVMDNYTEAVWKKNVKVIDVAGLDGETQFWELTSPIALPFAYYFLLKARKDPLQTTKAYFASGDGLRVNVQANGFVEEVGGAMLLDGEIIKNYTSAYPNDYFEHLIKYTIQNPEGVNLKYLGVQNGGFSERLKGSVYDLQVYSDTDELIHAIPLNNVEQGANQVATVGNINAFMPNFTDAVWKKETSYE